MPDPRPTASAMLDPLVAELARGERDFAAGRFGPACRIAYDVVENAGKAALVAVGVSPPKWADVGPHLDRHRELFPEAHRGGIDTLIFSLRVAWEEREAGFESGVGEARAEHLYDDYDARGAPDTAARVLAKVRALIDAG